MATSAGLYLLASVSYAATDEREPATNVSAFDNNGQDITRPEPETKIELRLERRTSGTTSKTEREYVEIRISGTLDLKSAWGFSWFAQLPLV